MLRKYSERMIQFCQVLKLMQKDWLEKVNTQERVYYFSTDYIKDYPNYKTQHITPTAKVHRDVGICRRP